MQRTVLPVLEPECALAAKDGHGATDAEQRRKASSHRQAHNYEYGYFEGAHRFLGPAPIALCGVGRLRLIGSWHLKN
jgi:hypothetical protein